MTPESANMGIRPVSNIWVSQCQQLVHAVSDTEGSDADAKMSVIS